MPLLPGFCLSLVALDILALNPGPPPAASLYPIPGGPDSFRALLSLSEPLAFLLWAVTMARKKGRPVLGQPMAMEDVPPSPVSSSLLSWMKHTCVCVDVGSHQ